MKTLRALSKLVLVAAAIGFVARDAAAQPVDNLSADGTTAWYVETVGTAGARLCYSSGCASYIGIDGGNVSGTLDHTGAFTWDLGQSGFPTFGTGVYIGGTQVFAQIQFRNAAGTFDASIAGNGSISLTQDVRLKFTGAVSCTTGWANNVTISATDYSYSNGFFGTSGTQGDSGTFTMPAFLSTACGGNGNTINSNFNLGTTNSYYLHWHYGRISNPEILSGSP